MERSIAITGMGAVTPYGCGVEPLWEALLEKRSAISEMDLFDLGGIACTRAGVIRDFTPPPGFDNLPRAAAFAAAACIEALTQAGVADNPAELAATALITASNFGSIDGGEAALIPPDNPDYDPTRSIHCAHCDTAEVIAERLGIGGPRLSLSLSCASGASAAVTAAELIAGGCAERILIVGYDALSRFSWSGLCALRTMTRECVRPFDTNRSGTIFTEGAAALVLETTAAQCAPLAYLTGWASGNNGHHMTAPAPRGAGSAYVMQQALEMAGLPPARVDHINTHGTGTKPNDVTETQAIQDTFGEVAAASIPVTSVKSSLGHMLGAAGAVELIVSALSLQRGVIPPTANLEHQDPECPLNVVAAPLQRTLNTVLSNSAGFGGCNAAVIISREPPPVPAAGERRRVFIKGSALICALGCDSAEIRTALVEGENACFPLERFDVPGAAQPPECGEVHDLEIADFGVSAKPYLDDASRLFLCACGAALEDAGRDRDALAALNAGIMAGTAWGCSTTQQLFFADFINKGPRLVKPFIFPHAYSNTAVSLAAMEWSLTGPHENITTPRTASGIALLEACQSVSGAACGCVLAVGCDALSVPRLLCAPAGEAQGEAAAALLLESDGTGAAAEIAGWGMACDTAGAVRIALAQAGLSAEAVETAESVERLSGALAGAATVADICAALVRGVRRPTLITTAEASVAVAFIIRPPQP